MGIETAIIGAAVIGAGSSIVQAKEARKANRAAQRAEQARAARERRQAIRQQRVASADFTNTAAASGVAGTAGSSVQGQLGGLSTNTAANIGFAAQLDELRNRQLRAQERANTAGLVGNLAAQGAGTAGSL